MKTEISTVMKEIESRQGKNYELWQETRAWSIAYFAEIYQPLYADYSAWFDKPFMIGEFGSNSIGGNKVAWVDTMFREIPQFNRIKVAIWWSGVDWDQAGRPARIYLLDENPATEAAFQRGLKNFPLQKQ